MRTTPSRSTFQISENCFSTPFKTKTLLTLFLSFTSKSPLTEHTAANLCQCANSLPVPLHSPGPSSSPSTVPFKPNGRITYQPPLHEVMNEQSKNRNKQRKNTCWMDAAMLFVPWSVGDADGPTLFLASFSFWVSANLTTIGVEQPWNKYHPRSCNHTF